MIHPEIPQNNPTEKPIAHERDPLTVMEAKISLITDGIYVSEDTAQQLSNGDPLTLADYASTSGITLRIGKNTWVNAPTAEHNPNFVSSSSNQLIVEDGKTYVVADGKLFNAAFLPIPKYHQQLLSNGDRVTNYAVTHADRVRISPIDGCSITCNYCDVPFDKPEGAPQYRGGRSINGLIESVQIALDDKQLPAQHVLISGGTPRRRDYGYQTEMYEAVATSFPGVDVDVMMVPMPGLLDLGRLKRAGVHGFSINLELYNKDIALEIMRNKAKASRELYFDFIERAVEEFGFGKVRSLLLVGLEPLEDTLKGVEELAKRGCDPVLSPFRPDPITPLAHLSPPSKEDLMYVFAASYKIVDKYPGVKLGPRCIPCMHNTLSFPDGSDAYYHSHQSEY